MVMVVAKSWKKLLTVPLFFLPTPSPLKDPIPPITYTTARGPCRLPGKPVFPEEVFQHDEDPPEGQIGRMGMVAYVIARMLIRKSYIGQFPGKKVPIAIVPMYFLFLSK